MDQESGPDLRGVWGGRFSVLGSHKAEINLFLCGHSTREVSIPKLPQVAGKMHFLIAIQFMTACFFSQQWQAKVSMFLQVTSRRKTGPLFYNLTNYTRPTQ